MSAAPTMCMYAPAPAPIFDIAGERHRLVVGRNVRSPGERRTFVNVNSGLVTIGDNVVFGTNVCLLTGWHDMTRRNEERIRHAIDGFDIRIGAGVWLASNVLVLGGVTIGEHAVVGAGAVVTKDIPAGEFWAGNPARLVKVIEFKD